MHRTYRGTPNLDKAFSLRAVKLLHEKSSLAPVNLCNSYHQTLFFQCIMNHQVPREMLKPFGFALDF